MAGATRTRTRKNQIAPVIPTNSVVASAVRYPGKIERIYRPVTSWQNEAWAFYDITPELRFAAGWIGNALSRCLMGPGEVNDDGNVAISTNGLIKASLLEFFSGTQGQAQMLEALGIHLTIAGEAYIVGRRGYQPGPDGQPIQDDETTWEVIGSQEIKSGPRWQIDYGNGIEPIYLDDQDTVIRVWRPHPGRRMEADSPVRALLPVLREIKEFTDHIDAQNTSRLAGAGIFALPQSLEFPGSDQLANKAESFSKRLADAMIKPIEDRSNASAVVPIVITVADDSLEKLREPITFWSPFDEKVVDSRKAAILRFCVGMDIPPEVIMGMTHGSSSSGGTGTGASHWTAWQIEESAIKLHIEPLLEVIGNAIVVGYLRVVTDNPKAAVVYNTDALKLQPDRSKEALELYDRGLINAVGLRKMSGISEDYALSDEELMVWMLRKVAGASAAPDQLAYAFKQLFPGQMSDFPDGGDQIPGHPGTNQQDPSLRDHPSGRTPPEGASIQAAEALVLRALEKAGNRLRAQGVKPERWVPAYETHTHTLARGYDPVKLLEEAWSTAPIVLDGDPEVGQTIRKLNTYATMLLVTQSKHDRSVMCEYLDLG